MKKLNRQFSEAEDGLEALEEYQEGSVWFDIILMGKLTSSDLSIRSPIAL
jgi:hypothetical protein